MFRPQNTLRKTRIKLYNTLVLPAVLHGSENWTIKARENKKNNSIRDDIQRKISGHTWTYYKTNTEIAKELNITPGLDRIQEYRRNWLQHMNRMPHDSLPRILKNYRPTGRRNQGKPIKRLLDV